MQSNSFSAEATYFLHVNYPMLAYLLMETFFLKFLKEILFIFLMMFLDEQKILMESYVYFFFLYS